MPVVWSVGPSEIARIRMRGRGDLSGQQQRISRHNIKGKPGARQEQGRDPWG